MRAYEVVTIAALSLAGRPSAALSWAAVRADEAVVIAAEQVPVLDGRAITSLGVIACEDDDCGPIPMQVDERAADGRWVLDEGPEASADSPPGVLDGGDTILVMAADAGSPARPDRLPSYQAMVEVMIHDESDGTVGWVYLIATDGLAPRSPRSYVRYDAGADRIHGGGVSMGFAGGVPAFLAIDDGPNLLDRLKVRASARLLFGLLRFSRSEDDLSTELAGWHGGPIRIIRSQRQRVRLGWGIRSPTFGSYTYFTRSAADLPVALRLNFRATYFVSDVDITAVLDFRGLAGWTVVVPGGDAALVVGGGMDPMKHQLNERQADWVALRGPRLTLLQRLQVGPSLASVRRRLVYRENPDPVDRPESYPGEEPGVGYRLDQWGEVGSGHHDFAAHSYAVPNQTDVAAFIAAREQPLRVYIQASP